MSASKALSVALLGVALSVGASTGIARAETPSTATPTTEADRDFVRLSKDGAQAFEELHLARMAIFNADPQAAQAWVDAAKAAIERAQVDETIHMAAESELSTLAQIKKVSGAGDKKDAPSASKKWLPVDAQTVLGEDFTATPEKKAALEEANKSLAKGDKKGALEKLRLAKVDLSSIVALLPLDQTSADVKAADGLMTQGKYYEAGVLLKSIADSMRYVVVSETGKPAKAAK